MSGLMKILKTDFISTNYSVIPELNTRSFAAFALCGSMLGGCSGGAGLPDLGAVAASSQSAAKAVVSGQDVSASGTPDAVYAVIAQKAMRCWFGPDGPLKSSHIFHADVSPPSDKGSTADIVLHERDTTQPTPRGARAFRILLTANGDTATHVEISNSKLPDDLADALNSDVVDWMRGGDSCHAQRVRPPKAASPVETGSLPVKTGKSKKPLSAARQANGKNP